MVFQEADQGNQKLENTVISWLNDQAIPLVSIDPDSPSTDLEPIKELIGSARIVGMGEATHGSKEFTQARHKILRFLIEKIGFNGLILETPVEEAKRIDKYIKTGEGDARSIQNQMSYWVHDTQEYLEVIEWMKKYNSEHPDRQISFYGCDIPVDDIRRKQPMNIRDKAMADETLAILNHSGNNSKYILWSHNYHISRLDFPDYQTQGFYLQTTLGNEYLPLATLFNEGGFNAHSWDEENQLAGVRKAFRMEKAPKGTYEWFFAQTGIPQAIFDIRDTINQSFFQETQPVFLKVRGSGSIHTDEIPEYSSSSVGLVSAFDRIIWIDRVTPSTLFRV